MSRIPLHVDDDFVIEVEFNRRGALFLHNTVKRYNREVKGKIQEAFEKVKESLRKAGVKAIYTCVKGEKVEKYNRMFGFRGTGIYDPYFRAEILAIKL